MSDATHTVDSCQAIIEAHHPEILPGASLDDRVRLLCKSLNATQSIVDLHESHCEALAALCIVADDQRRLGRIVYRCRGCSESWIEGDEEAHREACLVDRYREESRAKAG